MKRTWRVDNATIVEYKTGSFGRQTVSVNDEEFYRRRPWRGKALYEFVVPGSGAKAALEVRPAVVSGPAQTELRVGGRLGLCALHEKLVARINGAQSGEGSQAVFGDRFS